MHKYILKRIILLIPIILGVSFIVFSIMSFTPGDPGRLILGQTAKQEAVDSLNNELGYNKPFLVRYVNYVAKAATGDFGNSYRTGNPVFKEIFTRFPTTMTIALLAVITGVVLGIPLGILSAVKQYSTVDFISTVAAMLMASIPGFWLGLMMIILFSLKLGWLPSNGVGSFAHFIMPTIILSIPFAAQLLRMTRTTMLETIRQDYIRTARAKGATERTVIWKHALKNALLPVITVAGMELGALLGGTVVAEAVFSIPGIGTLILTAIRMKDIPQVMATVIFLASLFCIIMMLVDILSSFIDPRIRARYVK
ncbi:ABC transporter permease [Desulfosporosinus sp. BICA1-9]|uniref:ABC transporter permease n=1 Tax=Desulfosporosinus sp. BICA1-9 TaxID=1531958 RepID=UPI00054BD4E9|nr:ABC transporter permease [Desulfosporosinus sp. BICA1-9]KJS47488.1 MAG: peptide ABC transporter permease [Peptococcaceae bacterium BRH_c23]KJS84531.1 MAG: peptide ABC transporter permease [Desulfosporosinus sp. BICA1-9]HBW37553.1 ABC transporter permease [Desulfosporosinus sp.]